MRTILLVVSVSVLNLCLFLLVSSPGGHAGEPDCMPGDVHGDGLFDISDPIHLL